MADFAYDDDPTHTVPVPLAPRSEMRLRAPSSYAIEMAHAVALLDRALPPEERDVIAYLQAVQLATADVEERAEDLGAVHVTRAWLQACVEWLDGVTQTLSSAYAYAGDERRTALDLAAEESSMRLVMRLEREAAETVSVLRNLDANASRAAAELAATIDLADRMLRVVAAR